MSFSPAFSIGQYPANPSIVIAVDESVGSDGSISFRKIFVQDANGNYLVPSGTTTQFTVWPLADLSISLNILTNDVAAVVTVQWCDSGGNMLYESAQTYCFPLFSKQFAYQLIQGLVPPITLDTNYSASLANLWTSIIGAVNAVEVGGDIFASQNALNQAIYLRTNQSLFF